MAATATLQLTFAAIR